MKHWLFLRDSLKSSLLWEMSVSVLQRGAHCLSPLPPADRMATTLWLPGLGLHRGCTAGTRGNSPLLRAAAGNAVDQIIYGREATGSTDIETAVRFIIFWFYREVFMWEYSAYITCVCTNKQNLDIYLSIWMSLSAQHRIHTCFRQMSTSDEFWWFVMYCTCSWSFLMTMCYVDSEGSC